VATYKASSAPAFQADGAYASGWGIAAGGTFEPASMDAVKAERTQMRREKAFIRRRRRRLAASIYSSASPSSRQTT
jgi:hypothetical protein